MELKEKAEKLGLEVPEIEEIWLYEDNIIVIGGAREDILEKSTFDTYVGFCRKKTSLYDSVSARGTLLFER